MNMPERVSPRDMLDIIFANRNRAYGAYLLRREYPTTMRRALGWGMLLIGFFIFLPQLITAISAALPSDALRSTEYVIIPPPPIEVITPPPPVIETPPPPSRATVTYVPPVVVTEDQPEDLVTHAVEEILNTTAVVGTKDQEGDEDAPPDLDENPIGLTYVEDVPIKEDNTTYDITGVQKPPSFPGGEHDLLKFLAENIRYPDLARENNISGNVVLTFVVNKDGAVSDAQILRDIGGGCGKEALRVLALMPRWSPGEASGHPVKVRFTLPVRYRLD